MKRAAEPMSTARLPLHLKNTSNRTVELMAVGLYRQPQYSQHARCCASHSDLLPPFGLHRWYCRSQTPPGEQGPGCVCDLAGWPTEAADAIRVKVNSSENRNLLIICYLLVFCGMLGAQVNVVCKTIPIQLGC